MILRISAYFLLSAQNCAHSRDARSRPLDAYNYAQNLQQRPIMRTMMRKKSANLSISNVERLAEGLRATRRERKLTQQALAEQAGVARRTVTNAEHAGNVGVRELCRLVNALGYEVVLRPMDTVVLEDLNDIFRDDE
ncbi:helix-turn-helix domain-containing protein [Paraburkholderia guartelaensis]|uniref:helix-turn-helix domain-containing protein n=1 Tax=Paraburkholderia guartelaensis TaxID=2546446 RepID=UPI002AB7BF16|nr:helix-turn-helix domain-containing protein [Paraburkholderia guartelaensis]